jgi:hypothetical protein
MPSPFGNGFGSLNDQATRPVIYQGKATCGKYREKSFDWILENAPRYLVTLYEKHENHGMTRDQYKLAQLAVEQRDEDREDESREAGYDYNDFWGR